MTFIIEPANRVKPPVKTDINTLSIFKEEKDLYSVETGKVRYDITMLANQTWIIVRYSWEIEVFWNTSNPPTEIF